MATPAKSDKIVKSKTLVAKSDSPGYKTIKVSTDTKDSYKEEKKKNQSITIKPKPE